MTDKYILEGHEVVAVEGEGDEPLLRWGRWLEEHRAECRVGHDQLGDYEISTLFFGLEMNIHRLIVNGSRSPSHLFETVVFSGFQRSGPILAQERYSTWAEAEAGHARFVKAYRRTSTG